MAKKYPSYQDPTISNWLYNNAVAIKTKRVVVQNVDFLLQAGDKFKIILEQKSMLSRLENEKAIWVSRAQYIFIRQLAKQLGCKAEYIINKPNQNEYCYTLDIVKSWLPASGKQVVIKLNQCKKETKTKWLTRMRKILANEQDKVFMYHMAISM